MDIPEANTGTSTFPPSLARHEILCTGVSVPDCNSYCQRWVWQVLVTNIQTWLVQCPESRVALHALLAASCLPLAGSSGRCEPMSQTELRLTIPQCNEPTPHLHSITSSQRTTSATHLHIVSTLISVRHIRLSVAVALYTS